MLNTLVSHAMKVWYNESEQGRNPSNLPQYNPLPSIQNLKAVNRTDNTGEDNIELIAALQSVPINNPHLQTKELEETNKEATVNKEWRVKSEIPSSVPALPMLPPFGRFPFLPHTSQSEKAMYLPAQNDPSFSAFCPAVRPVSSDSNADTACSSSSAFQSSFSPSLPVSSASENKDVQTTQSQVCTYPSITSIDDEKDPIPPYPVIPYSLASFIIKVDSMSSIT